MMFKKWLTTSVLTGSCIALIAACGGGGGGSADNDEGATPPSSLSSWTIGPSSHEGGAAASRQNNAINTVATIAGTVAADPASSPYAGSVVTIQALSAGSGTYSLTPSLAELLRILQESPGSAAAYLTAIAGTVQVSPLASTQWRSVAGTVSVTVDASGVYRYSTTEPVTLTRDIDLGDGIPDAPDQIDITLDNVFGPIP